MEIVAKRESFCFLIVPDFCTATRAAAATAHGKNNTNNKKQVLRRFEKGGGGCDLGLAKAQQIFVMYILSRTKIIMIRI